MESDISSIQAPIFSRGIVVQNGQTRLGSAIPPAAAELFAGPPQVDKLPGVGSASPGQP